MPKGYLKDGGESIGPTPVLRGLYTVIISAATAEKIMGASSIKASLAPLALVRLLKNLSKADKLGLPQPVLIRGSIIA